MFPSTSTTSPLDKEMAGLAARVLETGGVAFLYAHRRGRPPGGSEAGPIDRAPGKVIERLLGKILGRAIYRGLDRVLGQAIDRAPGWVLDRPLPFRRDAQSAPGLLRHMHHLAGLWSGGGGGGGGGGNVLLRHFMCLVSQRLVCLVSFGHSPRMHPAPHSLGHPTNQRKRGAAAPRCTLLFAFRLWALAPPIVHPPSLFLLPL
jgi:hypothetical protein